MAGDGTLLTTDDFEEWRHRYDRLDPPGPYHSPGSPSRLAAVYRETAAR